MICILRSETETPKSIELASRVAMVADCGGAIKGGRIGCGRLRACMLLCLRVPLETERKRRAEGLHRRGARSVCSLLLFASRC